MTEAARALNQFAEQAARGPLPRPAPRGTQHAARSTKHANQTQ